MISQRQRGIAQLHLAERLWRTSRSFAERAWSLLNGLLDWWIDGLLDGWTRRELIEHGQERRESLAGASRGDDQDIAALLIARPGQLLRFGRFRESLQKPRCDLRRRKPMERRVGCCAFAWGGTGPAFLD